MSKPPASNAPPKLPATQPNAQTIPALHLYLVPERLIRPFRDIDWTNAIPPHVYPGDVKRPEMLEVIKKSIEASPSASNLLDLQHALEDALAEPPNHNVNMTAVALLMDSSLRKPDNPPVYLEALAFDLVDEGFPPAVVAAACERLRRENKFMPSIAEILATCRDVLKSYISLQRISGHCLKALIHAEDMISLAKDE